MRQTVGGISILDDNYIFAIQHPDKWRLNSSSTQIGISGIGGGVDNGETLIEALEREYIEEVNSPFQAVDSDKTFELSNGKLKPIQFNSPIRPLCKYHQKDVKRNGQFIESFLFNGTLSQTPEMSDLGGLIYIPVKEMSAFDPTKSYTLSELEQIGSKYELNSSFPKNYQLIPLGSLRLIPSLLQLSTNPL